MQTPEFIEIAGLTGRRPTECACPTCKNMCHRAPCLGTPADMLRLINNGLGADLLPTLNGAGVPIGLPVVPMVMARQKPGGACAFLDPAGGCTLHASGLKPTEGKLANCKTANDGGVVALIFKAWVKRENGRTVDLILKYLNRTAGHERNAENRVIFL